MVFHAVKLALVFTMAALSQTSPARAQDDPLAGAKLYADVQRYAAFGIHRFGTDADRGTTDWIADELAKAGFAVAFQEFSLGKQYFLGRATITIGSDSIEAMPFW